MDGLLAAINALRMLVVGSYGPVGDEVLVFSPPDAPFITADGHTILRAKRQQHNAADGQRTTSSFFERVILDAAEGVYRELGDGTTEFVLLLHGLLNHIIQKGGGERLGTAERVAIARALASMRHRWDAHQMPRNLKSLLSVEEMAVTKGREGELLKIPDLVLKRVVQILTTALAGMIGRQDMRSIVWLVMDWVFSMIQPNSAESFSTTTYRRLQTYLQQAPRAIVHVQHGSFRDSQVVSRKDFVLGKSLIPSQLPSLLISSRPVSFVCVSGKLDLFNGANQIVFDGETHDNVTCTVGGLHSRVAEFLKVLSSLHNVQLVISTDKIEDYVASACNRLRIACVQYAENEDVDTLCMIAGILPMTGVLDNIRDELHVGMCEQISVFRHTHKPSLHFKTIRSKLILDDSSVVPQLLVHASSKGIYKQYYNAVLKCLRVLRCLFTGDGSPCFTLCRGAGATELALAKGFREEAGRIERVGYPDIHARVAIYALSKALEESVTQLHANLTKGCGLRDDNRATVTSRRVLLESMSHVDDASCCGYIMDFSNTISTKLGSICIPTKSYRDPFEVNIVHPWWRIHYVIRAVLQTAETLLRVDTVILVKQKSSMETQYPQ